MVIFLIIVILGIGGWVYYSNKKALDAAIEAGEMRKRPSNFIDKTYVFITKVNSSAKIEKSLTEILNLEKAKITMSDFKNDYADFASQAASGSFQARLQKLEEAKGAKEHKWQFNAIHYQQYRGTTRVADVTGMNLLLTAIEKAFVQLDPETEVEERFTKMKTKTKLF